MSQPWYKSELAIAGAIISLLLTLLIGAVKWEMGNFKEEFAERKAQDKAQ